MAIVIKPITVEVSKPNIFQAIAAKQNDSNSRFLKVTFVNEGEKISITPSSRVTINATRNDGQSESFFGEVNDDGTATMPIHSWILELAGHVNCDVSIIEEDSKLTCTTFSLLVEEAAHSSDDISEDEQYDVLTELINEAHALGGVPGPPGPPGEKGDKGDKGDTPEILDASTTQKGVVQLDDSLTSTSKTKAATANAVRQLYSYTDKGSGNNTNGGSFNLLRGKKNAIVNGNRNIVAGDSNVIGDDSTTSSDNLVAGTGNKVFSSCHLVVGGDNVTTPKSYCNIVGGSANNIDGSHSMVIGYANIIESPDRKEDGTNPTEGVAIVGHNNHVNQKRCLVAGRYLKTGKEDQSVFGRYNAPDSDSYIVVGGGTSEDDRKNIFTVNKTGIPTKPTDAITLEYLNKAIETAITTALTTDI